jgi:hypothetical protein
MAGEWIKVRTNLWTDPRVSQLCDLTDASKPAVVGALYWLWSSADEHTQDGHMPGLSLKAIDRESGVPGMGAALLSIDWIADTPGGITLTRFEEHNGASAKSRAQTAKRVANHKTNAVVTQSVTQLHEIANAVTVTSALPREEKRREEVKANTPIPPSGAIVPVKKVRAAISLKTFLAECKAEGVKPVPEDDCVFDYAAEAGISHDVLALQWSEFRARYTVEGAKKYKAWRIVFGKSVRGNWFKLWYFDNNGNCALTSAGVQAKNTAEAAKRKAA